MRASGVSLLTLYRPILLLSGGADRPQRAADGLRAPLGQPLPPGAAAGDRHPDGVAAGRAAGVLRGMGGQGRLRLRGAAPAASAGRGSSSPSRSPRARRTRSPPRTGARSWSTRPANGWSCGCTTPSSTRSTSTPRTATRSAATSGSTWSSTTSSPPSRRPRSRPPRGSASSPSGSSRDLARRPVDRRRAAEPGPGRDPQEVLDPRRLPGLRPLRPAAGDQQPARRQGVRLRAVDRHPDRLLHPAQQRRGGGALRPDPGLAGDVAPEHPAGGARGLPADPAQPRQEPAADPHRPLDPGGRLGGHPGPQGDPPGAAPGAARGAAARARRARQKQAEARVPRLVLLLPRLRIVFPNLLDRYVARLFVWVFLLVVLSGLSLFIIFDLSENIDEHPEEQGRHRGGAELLQVPVAADVLRDRPDRGPGDDAADLQPARADERDHRLQVAGDEPLPALACRRWPRRCW